MRAFFQFCTCLCLGVPGLMVQAQQGAPAPLSPVPAPASVEVFRQLLALPKSERDRVLSERPPEQRELLAAKIEEYAVLPPDERERRLDLVQLRAYLLPLMKLPPSGRSSELETIPEPHRSLIEERLTQWDGLPPALKQDVLNHEFALHYFIRIESSRGARSEMIWTSFPESYRQALQGRSQQWRALPDERRQRIYRDVRDFFDLPPRAKERTLDSLTEQERRGMEQTLQAFERLPPENRDRSIESLRKLASMTPEQQDQFLRNAERWKAMTLAERQTWRNLVTAIPPLPPGTGYPPPPPGFYQTDPPRGAESTLPPPQGTNRTGPPPP